MYELGCGIALVLWLGSLIWLFVLLNSQLERNLNKAGFRISWITLGPKPMGNNHFHRSFLRKFGKFATLALFGFFGIFFSWLYVAYFVGVIFYSRVKDAGAPQSVRELRWRMRNTEMDFDEVVEGLAAATKSSTPIDQLKANLRADMVERENA